MYFRHGNPTRCCGNEAATFVTAAIVAVVLLLGAGSAYRVYASRWQMSEDKHIELPVPLSKLPMQFDNWAGQDLEIEAGTEIYMRKHFADDYVSRRYINAGEQIWADVYVVYCATRIAGILGHQPRVCYPGNGWIWDSSTPSRFMTQSGRAVDCLMHSFHKPAPSLQQVYVLNFYVLNGRITVSEKDFSGWFGRKLNLAGDPARYVAQVQISSINEVSPKALASQMVDTIFAFLPDEDGQVAVAGASKRAMPAETAGRSND
jgi:EpsI family protein